LKGYQKSITCIKTDRLKRQKHEYIRKKETGGESDRCFFSFLLSLYLVFKLRLILCALLLYACLCWLCGM